MTSCEEEHHNCMQLIMLFSTNLLERWTLPASSELLLVSKVYTPPGIGYFIQSQSGVTVYLIDK